MLSPRRSLACSRPRSSIGVARGGRSKPSSSPPSHGWIGSITVGYSNRSATCLPLKPKRATMPKPRCKPWLHDPNQIASGKPGAVQTAQAQGSA